MTAHEVAELRHGTKDWLVSAYAALKNVHEQDRDLGRRLIEEQYEKLLSKLIVIYMMRGVL